PPSKSVFKCVYGSAPRAVASALHVKPRSLPLAVLIRRAFPYTQSQTHLESILELNPYFHPRTYKAINIGVISFGFDERLEARATIAASLPSTSEAARMFRESLNDLRARCVLQGSRKRDRDLLSLAGKEPGHDWRPAPLNT